MTPVAEPRIVFSRHYDIGLLGFERLHPFDSRKHGRAWKCLRRRFGARLRKLLVRPDRPISRVELLEVHSADYLDRLGQSKYVAGILEMPPLGWLPRRAIDWCVLRPMRWATRGTMIAAREATNYGLAFNLAGGYHHAKPSGGEGFSAYADIALAIHQLRMEGRLRHDERVAYVDLDAHQGNGVCHCFMHDPRVFIFDMYNSTIYPSYDRQARSRIDCAVPLTGNCQEADYLRALRSKLPAFIDSIGRAGPLGLGIYNAGTDVYKNDRLGGLHLSAEGILERDVFVIEELRRRGIPTVVLPSGGYSRQSYALMAKSIEYFLDQSPATFSG